jgi:hypothetical protein
MLKTQMDNLERDNQATMKGELSYNKLSKGCSRHTAASVFFELLQLKTWDFIELDQDEKLWRYQDHSWSSFQRKPTVKLISKVHLSCCKKNQYGSA